MRQYFTTITLTSQVQFLAQYRAISKGLIYSDVSNWWIWLHLEILQKVNSLWMTVSHGTKTPLMNINVEVTLQSYLPGMCGTVENRCNRISLQFSALSSPISSSLFHLSHWSFKNRQYACFPSIEHVPANRKMAGLLWSEQYSLLYTDSTLNKLRLEKWALLVLLFSSLCPQNFLSVVSLYGKSLTTDWLPRKSTISVPI